MSELNLNFTEKEAVQSFTQELQQANDHDFYSFKTNFTKGNNAAWHRFIKGAYSHPLTWWMGIFHLQMQMGIWGHHHQSIARIRANKLWKITRPARDNVTKAGDKKSRSIFSEIVEYNLKNRKADLLGRFAGGMFTSYVTKGGGVKKLRQITKKSKIPIPFANYVIASYGSAIKALINGHDTLEEIAQSVLTGDASHLPKNFNSDNGEKLSQEEQEILEEVESAFSGMMSLSTVKPPPVPIKEFCSRPENIDLKGLCR